FYGLLCATGAYDRNLALSFLGINEGKYTQGRLEQYAEGRINDTLVGEIVELTGTLEELAPENFSRDEDDFRTVISLQKDSEKILEGFSLVRKI
ncbi:MAG: hypothetical protein ACI4KB_07755, partial [Oscillospiraceae bacterium]